MRRLVIMRHAKSDWGNPSIDDHDRPLNQRGRLAAGLMGAYLTDINFRPDHTIISSAARTQETFAHMRLGDMEHETTPYLYNATAAEVINTIKGAPNQAKTLLVIAHQPGVQQAANTLIDGWLIEKFPTGKLVILNCIADHWGDIGPYNCTLELQTAPKDLI
ncbi:MAG: SixA phosphatase family protein [Pikeienuella sp.]